MSVVNPVARTTQPRPEPEPATPEETCSYQLPRLVSLFAVLYLSRDLYMYHPETIKASEPQTIKRQNWDIPHIQSSEP
eukprot:2931305-Prymnesium_polylepis.1